MNRLAWIDNLRVLTIILVVILHTAVTYSGLGGWYYEEETELDMLSMILFAFFQTFTQAYFMSLLFMVSGYFTRRSLEKKGTANFLGGRLRRLGIPLLIYVFIIHALTVKLAYPDLDIYEWYLNGLKNFYFLSWTGPLWFVEALLIFTFLYVLIGKLVSVNIEKLQVTIRYPGVFGLILLITAVAFLFRLVYPIGTDFYNLQFSFFSAYIFMFIAGILAYQAGVFDKITYEDGKRWLFISLGVGIPLWALIIVFGGALEDNMQMLGGWNWPALFYALWESFFCVTFIIALLGIFKHKVNISNRFQQFLSDQAFGVFVFHAPVLVGLSMMLNTWEIYPLLKFFIVFPMALIASFFVSWLMRRIPLLRKVFS
jgi:surface polysaccharide O-acyltransferase-like enzyme